MSGTDTRPSKSGLAISQALTRPQLVAGCERAGFGLATGAGAGLVMLAWQSWSPVAAAGGVLFLTLGLTLLRRMARNDPQFWAVYQRNRRYRAFYPARSTPWRKD